MKTRFVEKGIRDLAMVVLVDELHHELVYLVRLRRKMLRPANEHGFFLLSTYSPLRIVANPLFPGFKYNPMSVDLASFAILPASLTQPT